MAKEIQRWDLDGQMYATREGEYITYADYLTAISDLERKHSKNLSDCRKKCGDFGRKINDLAHENKRLRAAERKHREEMEGMLREIQETTQLGVIDGGVVVFNEEILKVFAAHGINLNKEGV